MQAHIIMDTCPDNKTLTQHTGDDSRNPDDAVYQDQVQLLYQHLRLSLVAALLVAPVFSFVIWERTETYSILIWLTLSLTLTGCRFWLGYQFNRYPLHKSNVRKWEQYFLISIIASALLWGSTCLWLELESPLFHQTLIVFIISGLIGGSIASLASRPRAFRIFIILVLLPYIIKIISFGDTPHTIIAGLLVLYLFLMISISTSITCVIQKSLELHYTNNELLNSYKRANEALFEVMKKNKQKEQKLQESETFLKSIFETANDGILTTDSKGTILAINHAVERDFGYTEQEMLGNNINMIMIDNMGLRHDRYMQEYIENEKTALVGRMLDVTGKAKNGKLFPVEITVSETHIGDNRYFTGIIRDTTQRKEQDTLMFNIMQELAEAKLELEEVNSQLQNHNIALTELSEHDSLTGLHNRRYLSKAFKHEWLRHQRNKTPISVILMDIDFFKRFNDSYGHQAGDICLKQIADELIKMIARPADFIARYGGEEFIAVLPETNLEGATLIAERMQRAVENLKIEHNDSSVANHVTISAGVSSIFPARHNNFDEIIKAADEALYAAKHSGRNCVKQHTQ